MKGYSLLSKKFSCSLGCPPSAFFVSVSISIQDLTSVRQYVTEMNSDYEV